MIDPAKLAAFAAITGLVSLTPGPQMVFVMTQAAWRGPRAGAAALAGLQLGNATWFLMAGLGLGTLALAAPDAFRLLTAAGALYLAWLGVHALKHARRRAVAASSGEAPQRMNAARVIEGKVELTRPLCPYPQVAKYRGTDDPNDAANFSCAAP